MSRYCYFVALLCLGAAVGRAQISTATMVGVVEDPSGAIVPNAEISLTKTSTNETRQTRATGSGEFNMPFLQIGTYSVTVAATGFKTKTLTGITLQVDQTVNLRVCSRSAHQPKRSKSRARRHWSIRRHRLWAR